MKRFRMFISILIILFPTQIIFSQTTEEIITAVIKAHGGEEKLRSVKNLVITGKTERQDESQPEVTYQFIIVFPDKYRYTFKIQDTRVVFASDGTSSWNINPMFGVKEPTEMNTNDALEQKHQLDFLIPFLDKNKIHDFENKGIITEDNKKYYILKVEYKDGFFADYFIDKESFLITKRRQIHRSDEGRESELIYTLGDYRLVEEIKFPFKFQSSLASLIYTIDSYEINVGNLEDSIFKMPKK